MSRRRALTFYYDDESGELIDTDESDRFALEGDLLRADVLNDIVAVIQDLYQDAWEEFADNLRAESPNQPAADAAAAQVTRQRVFTLGYDVNTRLVSISYDDDFGEHANTWTLVDAIRELHDLLVEAADLPIRRLLKSAEEEPPRD